MPIHHSTEFKGDFIPLKQEAFRQNKFNLRRKTDLLGKPVYVVSPENLLISTLIWIQDVQSGIQIEDIMNLSKVETLHKGYI